MISMTVRLMTWKQGWVYVQKWTWFLWRMVRLMTWKKGCIHELVHTWFQCSMEHLLRYFTWQCGSFSLLLILPTSGIMCCGILLLCLRGFVFGPNWVFIKCPQTQSDDLFKVLDVYDDHSCWFRCYGKRTTLSYLTGIRSILPQIWSWRHPWWIFNVSHVGYLKVYRSINEMNPFYYYLCR